MPKVVSVAGVKKRSFSDWFGCVFFVAFAVFLFRRAPGIGLLMLPTILHELLTAACFLFRGRARARLEGVGPRICSYGASFLMPLVMITISARHPEWLRLSHSTIALSVGAWVWLAGVPLMLGGLWNLRRSFSIEPQARELVTTGVYRFARHPIYTGYLLQYLGLWLAHMSAPLGIALGVWGLLLTMRVFYEEQVLAAAFPEYRAYQRRVGRFWPHWSQTVPIADYVNWKRATESELEKL